MFPHFDMETFERDVRAGYASAMREAEARAEGADSRQLVRVQVMLVDGALTTDLSLARASNEGIPAAIFLVGFGETVGQMIRSVLLNIHHLGEVDPSDAMGVIMAAVTESIMVDLDDPAYTTFDADIAPLESGRA